MSWFGRSWPAAAYPLTLLVATWVVRAQPPSRHAAWLAWASTDLTNLAAHPLGCLLVSAFLATECVAVWAVLAVLGLACTAARLGALRTAVLVGSAHVLATLASQAVVALRIHLGALPAGARRMPDIGPSYVVVAALVAGLAFGRPRTARIACAAVTVVLVPGLLAGLVTLQVAPLGHAAAILLTPASGALLLRWWPPVEHG